MNMTRSLSTLAILFLPLLVVACDPGSEVEEMSGTPPGRIISDAAANTDGVRRILLYYDMEGISGQNDIRSLSYGNPEYGPARGWLTDDVNAVIDGLFEGGADVVDVVDAHGSGNPEPDVLLERIDARAKLLDRDAPFRPYIDLTEAEIYDAVAVVCMHSSTGGGGFGAHTYTLGMDWILNGMSINETEIIAYSWGQVGVPVIFASGDDKLKEQLEWMDWLQYVTVKLAISADHAELRPLDEVHQDMRIAAAKAVENLSGAKAVSLTTPIQAQLRAVHPASLDQMEGVPGIDYVDQTVSFEARDYQEAYDGIEALIGVATGSYSDLMFEVLAGVPNRAELSASHREMLFQRWVDVESGRWVAPSTGTGTLSGRRYFGVR